MSIVIIDVLNPDDTPPEAAKEREEKDEALLRHYPLPEPQLEEVKIESRSAHIHKRLL